MCLNGTHPLAASAAARCFCCRSVTANSADEVDPALLTAPAAGLGISLAGSRAHGRFPNRLQATGYRRQCGFAAGHVPAACSRKSKSLSSYKPPQSWPGSVGPHSQPACGGLLLRQQAASPPPLSGRRATGCRVFRLRFFRRVSFPTIPRRRSISPAGIDRAPWTEGAEKTVRARQSVARSPMAAGTRYGHGSLRSLYQTYG